MSKTGRNEPCPCGSGKKYKKCCLRKDEERAASSGYVAAPKDLSEDEVSKYSYMDADEEFYEEEDDADEEFYGDYIKDTPYIEWGEENEEEPVESRPRKKISQEVPQITDEENALVDEWRNRYKRLEKSDEIKKHIEEFLAEHPKLVPNLELHWDVLFELGGQYLREGRSEEYIDLLLRIRKEFPDTYIKSFSYYDRDIISFKIITQRRDEINDYLGYFREYPGNDPELLFRVLENLMANNCQDIVTEFVRDVYYDFVTSPEVVGGGHIMQPLVMSYFIPYLKRDFSDRDIEQLIAELRGIKFVITDDYYKPKFLKDYFNCIFNDFSKWNIDDCEDKQEIYLRYRDITLNFMRFLHERKNKDWMAADFYRTLVYDYLTNSIPEKKKPKKAFIFTRDKIDTTIIKTSQTFFFINTTRALGMLNGLYFFAEYLEETESISREERETIQQWCSELYNAGFPVFVKNELSASAFKEFPF